MEILKIQQLFLEKIWKEEDEIEIQIIKDLLGKSGKRTQLIGDINDREIWEKLIPDELLAKLYHARTIWRLKTEQV